jgi:hypothetical protein
MKKNNNLIITIIIAALVGALGFYGGTQYQKNANFAGGINGQRRGFGGGQNAQNRPVRGQIVSQDDKSITVKMQDGSSKIVNVSDQTLINKASTGTKTDLKSGETVMVFGTTNSDGSVTAQSVSLGTGGMPGGGQKYGPRPTGQ